MIALLIDSWSGAIGSHQMSILLVLLGLYFYLQVSSQEKKKKTRKSPAFLQYSMNPVDNGKTTIEKKVSL